jgi:hypothetical protein
MDSIIEEPATVLPGLNLAIKGLNHIFNKQSKTENQSH